MSERPSPQIFGKYEPIRRVAVGGMGEVFLARQTGSVVGAERLVILKSLLPDLAKEEGFVEQFLDEARVAAQLNHPNIVQMYEAGAWGGIYFIAMEYIKGEDVAKIQKAARQKATAMPMNVLVRIVRDALMGLGQAHTATHAMTGEPLNIVHRDVSPQNIMVRIDGVTKVVDFGIAKSGNKAARTATGVLKGKLQYMAPEQVRGEELDGTADQWAMGVVMWEMLTGEKLFKGSSEIETLKAVLTQQVVSPRTINADIPDELEAACMRMLSRDSKDRFPTCLMAAEELTAWLGQSSRRVSEADVARFMREVCGDAIDEKTSNLSSQADFVIGFVTNPSGEMLYDPGTSPTQIREQAALQAAATKRQRTMGIAAGLVAAAAMVAAAVVFWPGHDDTPVAMAPMATTISDVETDVRALTAAVRPSNVKFDAAGGLRLPIDGPPGAEVLVDDVVAGVLPMELRLTPGPHKILIRHKGVEVPVPYQEQEVAFVVINADPPANVFYAGDDKGLTPVSIRALANEEFTFDVRKLGFAPRKESLTLRGGEVRNVAVKLNKGVEPPKKAGGTATTTITEPEPTGTGSITVASKPGGAAIWIDGYRRDSTPAVIEPIPSGKHTVKLVSPDDKEAIFTIIVKPGQSTKLNHTFK
jgi:serine/threonine protein kinase